MCTRPVALIAFGFVACATMLQTAAAEQIPFSLNLTTTSATLTTNTSVCGSDPVCANFSGTDFSIDFSGYSLPLVDVGAPLSSVFFEMGPGRLGLSGTGTLYISGTTLDLFRGMFFLTPPTSGTVPAGYATMQIPLPISFEATYCVEGIPTICDAGGSAFSNIDGFLTINFTPVTADTESFGSTFTEVPEPSGVLLVLIGLAGLLVGKRTLSLKAHNVREID
ncbi:MAG: PEP-CTERM sorting domain-containing protein [Bryobacteraceae bacterium]